MYRVEGAKNGLGQQLGRACFETRVDGLCLDGGVQAISDSKLHPSLQFTYSKMLCCVWGKMYKKTQNVENILFHRLERRNGNINVYIYVA